MSLLDLPGNTDLLARFLSLRQLAATAPSIVQRDQLGSILVQPPACVVTPPPLAPASGVGADAAVCLIDAAGLGVDVAGSSLPVCPLVATMISLFQCKFC